MQNDGSIPYRSIQEKSHATVYGNRYVLPLPPPRKIVIFYSTYISVTLLTLYVIPNQMVTRSSTRSKEIACDKANCAKKFATQSELGSHIYYEHKNHGSGIDKRFQCDWPQCGRVFRYLPQLESHKNLHVTAKVMDFAPNNLLKTVCQLCGETPAKGQTLSQHMTTAHKNSDEDINPDLLEPEVMIKTELIVPDYDDF